MNVPGGEDALATLCDDLAIRPKWTN